MELINYLKADHNAIRRVIHELRSTRELEDKREVFSQLDVLVASHNKAEQDAVYCHCIKKEDTEIRDLGRRGYEEHALIEDLILKIKCTIDAKVWQAEVRALADILDLHLDEEENELFLKIREDFSQTEIDEAAVYYLKIKKAEEIGRSGRRLEKIPDEQRGYVSP